MHSDKEKKPEIVGATDGRQIVDLQSDVHVQGTLKAQKSRARADQSKSQRYQVPGQAKVQPTKST